MSTQEFSCTSAEANPREDGGVFGAFWLRGERGVIRVKNNLEPPHGICLPFRPTSQIPVAHRSRVLPSMH